MREILEAILLGIIQGLTEFLPVSSSGHLEIAQNLLGIDNPAKDRLLLIVVLHFGTVVATIAVFRREIAHILRRFFSAHPEYLRYVSYIALSMIPAGFVGVFFDEEIEALFSGNITLVASMLMVTGIVLWWSDYVQNASKPLSVSAVVMMGLAQALAIIPGISRSGATIGTAVLCGVERTQAAQFSFLMVVPLIIGKMMLDVGEGAFRHTELSVGVLAAGFLASFVSGYLACRWMIQLVRTARLRYFAWYCIGLGIIVWIWMLYHS